MKNKVVEEQCMCNLGIAMGNLMVLDMQKNFEEEALKDVPSESEEEYS